MPARSQMYIKRTKWIISYKEVCGRVHLHPCRTTTDIRIVVSKIVGKRRNCEIPLQSYNRKLGRKIGRSTIKSEALAALLQPWKQTNLVS